MLYSQYSNNGMSPSDTRIEIMNADGSNKRTLFHQGGVTGVRQLTDNKWEDAVAGWKPEFN